MNTGLRWRAGAVLALVLIFAYLAASNFVPKEQRVASGFWPDDGLRLGLDLQGGIHWVVGVQIEQAATHELEFVRNNIRDNLADDGIEPLGATVEGTLLTFVAKGPEDTYFYLTFGSAWRSELDDYLDKVMLRCGLDPIF